MQRRLYGYRTLRVPSSEAVAQLRALVGDPEAAAQTVLVRTLGIPLRREVQVSFGEVVELDGGLSVPLSFRDAQRPDWFPIFEGAVDLMPIEGLDRVSQLTVVGAYSPPFGAVGQIGDMFVLGRRIGEATVVALLDGLADLIEPRIAVP